MDLVQKLTLLKDNDAEEIVCSSGLGNAAGKLDFKISRDEFCHALDAMSEWRDTRRREPVTKKAEQDYVSARRHFKNFDAIVGRFTRKFDIERVAFELYDYGNQLGILVRKGFDGHKLLILFDGRDGIEIVDSCVRFAQKWDQGDTEYKGIAADHFSEGQETSARAIHAGEVK